MVRASDIQPPNTSLDISDRWMNVVRRLRSAARGNRGLAFVKIIVMVGTDGEPKLWTDPTLVLLEPKLRAEDVMDNMSQEEMAQMLRAMTE